MVVPGSVAFLIIFMALTYAGYRIPRGVSNTNCKRPTPQPNRSKTFCAFQSCHHPRAFYWV